MFNRSYQRRRGELQDLGEILNAALETAHVDPKFYRPGRPIQIRNGHSGARRGCPRRIPVVSDPWQFSFQFPVEPEDAERPLADLFPQAYV